MERLLSLADMEGSEQNIINIMQVLNAAESPEIILEETLCFRSRLVYVFDCPFENRTLK